MALFKAVSLSALVVLAAARKAANKPRHEVISFMQRAEIKETKLMSLEGLARINAFIEASVAPQRKSDGIVVEVPLWDGHPWHIHPRSEKTFDDSVNASASLPDLDYEDPEFRMDTQTNRVRWGGVADDLMNVAIGLIVAEETGAKEVSFKQAEDARTDDGFKVGFDEVFPSFKNGVIPVTDPDKWTRSVTEEHVLAVENKHKGITVRPNGDSTLVAAGCCAYLTHGQLDSRDVRRVLRKYLGPALPKIRNPDLIPGNDELVIHINDGQSHVAWQPPPIPFEFYDKAIQDSGLKKIRIVSLKHSTNPAIKYLWQKYKGQVTIQHKGLVEDLQTLASAPNIMVDHMGFSWMAPMLNPAPKKVYIPHFFNKKEEDFLPEGLFSNVGYTFPRNEPDVHVCVLDAQKMKDEDTKELGEVGDFPYLLSSASEGKTNMDVPAFLKPGSGLLKIEKHCTMH